MAANPTTQQFKSVSAAAVAADKGHRRFMEDAHVIADGFLGVENCGLFAVFDGHGGKSAAEWAAAHVPALVAHAAKDAPTGLSATAFAEAFRAADAGLQAASIDFPGCTATLCCVVPATVSGSADRMLHVANVGDTHAVLCTPGQPWQRLTAEHRCTDDAEVARIKDRGGFVADERVNGMLAVTRTLGDLAMKEFISNEPAYRAVSLQPIGSGQCLIVACDGLWDVVAEADAVQVALETADARLAARELANRALKAGSTDNITVVVVKL